MSETSYSNVYEVIVTGYIQSVQTINRYFYGAAAPLGSLSYLAAAVHDNVNAGLVSVMHNASGFVATQVNEVKGGTRFYTEAYVQPGGVSGEGLPPFCSWDFTYVRGDLHERNGYKRIGGVPEVLQAYGEPTAGAAASLASIATTMAGNLLAGVVECIPVIQRKVIHHAHLVTPAYYSISSVQFSKIGSQNSRKFGHGR